MQRKNYKVYVYTNIINQKKYVGITRKNIKQKWNDGGGYSENKKFYKDIKKYGWDKFKHEVISDNCTYKEAIDLEAYLTKKYKTVENGYNNSYLGFGSVGRFDFFDFNPIDNKIIEYKNKVNYFTRIPNCFLQTNICKEYGLNRIFLLVWILIDRHRSYEDTSYICIGDLLELCGYKLTAHKPKIFYEAIKCLLFLNESGYIDTDFDIYTVDYKDCITIKIITESFDPDDTFTKIYGKDFDSIMASTIKPTKESILTVFLYINSYIGCRPRNDDGTERMHKPEIRPEAFWGSIECMSKELSMSKDTINQCIDYLTTSTGDRDALLVKREVGSVQTDPNKPPKNVPNIYVLNKDGYQQEIEWALNMMMKVYEVDEFISKAIPSMDNKAIELSSNSER